MKVWRFLAEIFPKIFRTISLKSWSNIFFRIQTEITISKVFLHQWIRLHSIHRRKIQRFIIGSNAHIFSWNIWYDHLWSIVHDVHSIWSLNENPAGVKNEAMFNFANRTSTTNQSYVSNKSNRSNRSKLTRSNGTSEYDNGHKRNKDRNRDSIESKARFWRQESHLELKA